MFQGNVIYNRIWSVGLSSPCLSHQIQYKGKVSEQRAFEVKKSLISKMQQGLVHVLGLYAVALCFDFQFSLKKNELDPSGG